jgi:hypothetical protein
LHSSFQDAVRERLELERAVGNQYRLLLVSLANRIILDLINTGTAREREGTAGLDNLISGVVGIGIRSPRNWKNSNPGAAIYESQEQSRKKFLNAYWERAGTIQELNSKELIKLIEQLRSDPLLERVLGRLAKKRITAMYKIEPSPERTLP